MKLYALIVIRRYEDNAKYESCRWDDAKLAGVFLTHESAENARKSLIDEIIKDDKQFRDYMWDGSIATVEQSLTHEEDPQVCWYDDVHHDNFTLICKIREVETGRLYDIEAP